MANRKGKRVQVALVPELLQQVEQFKEKNNVSMSRLMSIALQEFFNKYNQP
jgi:metal-responsive CopG/Arc/MetJ family transcriptional regulator